MYLVCPWLVTVFGDSQGRREARGSTTLPGIGCESLVDKQGKFGGQPLRYSPIWTQAVDDMWIQRPPIGQKYK